jgi:hypothetical protein
VYRDYVLREPPLQRFCVTLRPAGDVKDRIGPDPGRYQELRRGAEIDRISLVRVLHDVPIGLVWDDLG